MMQRVKRVSGDDTAILQQITELEVLCIPNPWSYDMFELEASRKGGIVLAAVDESGRVSGFLTAQQIMDTADINNVAVHPDCRRQGIGSLLLEEFFKEAQDAQIFLEVRASNAPAIGLYEAHGFQRISVRRSYYTNPIEDAIIMQYGGNQC